MRKQLVYIFLSCLVLGAAGFSHAQDEVIGVEAPVIKEEGLISDSAQQGSSYIKFRHFQQMSQEQKMLIKKGYLRFRKLSEQEQTVLKDKWRRFQELEPEQQRQVLKNFQRWQNLQPQQRQTLRLRLQQVNALPQDYIQKLRQQWQQAQSTEAPDGSQP